MELTTEPTKIMVQSKLNTTSVCTEIRKGMWMGLKFTVFCSTKL